MRSWLALVLLGSVGCDPAAGDPDARRDDAGSEDVGRDAEARTDALARADAPAPRDDAGPAPDAASDSATGELSLSGERDRLIGTLGADACATWAGWDESTRAVFLTITHRLFVARTPDGVPALSHLESLSLVLGGGASGTSCGGSENNRVFAIMDDVLWRAMLDTAGGATVLTDADGTSYVPTRDAAGPHDPFTASIESDRGLRCTLIFEGEGSRPPTAQAHFFLEGDATSVERGPISLPAHPRMLEIDQDYNCVHDSNPTCRDFADRYRDNHGDFTCDWTPSTCTPLGAGCYRGAS